MQITIENPAQLKLTLTRVIELVRDQDGSVAWEDAEELEKVLEQLK